MEFILHKGEIIIKDIKPSSRIIWYYAIRSLKWNTILAFIILNYLIIDFSLSSFSSSFSYFSFPSLFNEFFTFEVIALMIITFIFPFIYGLLRYSKQHYWITNQRIVYKHGVIGYAIVSIPYNRISDVIISRDLLERLLGFGSILIQTLAGQWSEGRMGAEVSLVAVPDPEGTQKLIFELMKRKSTDLK